MLCSFWKGSMLKSFELSTHLDCLFEFGLLSSLRANGISNLLASIYRSSHQCNALMAFTGQSSLQQLHVVVQIFGRNTSQLGAIQEGNDCRTRLQLIHELAKVHRPMQWVSISYKLKSIRNFKEHKLVSCKLVDLCILSWLDARIKSPWPFKMC